MALPSKSAQNQRMPTWGSYSYVYGPMMALVAIGVLVLVLRWASARQLGRGATAAQRRP